MRTTPRICGLEWVFGVLIQSIPWFRYSENSRTIECDMKTIGNSSPAWLAGLCLLFRQHKFSFVRLPLCRRTNMSELHGFHVKDNTH